MAKSKNEYQEPKSCTVELPKLRYLDDATRYLDRVKDDVDETENLIRVQQKALAYLSKPKDSVTASLNRPKIDTAVKKLVVPNIQKLESQYGLAEELYDRYRALEALESQVALQFPDRKGEALVRVQQQLAELKSKVRDQIRRVLEFLTEIAHKHVPTSFEHARQALAQELENNIRFDGSEQFLYVSVDAGGSLVFTSYIMLRGARSDDGRRVPTLYVSLQWVVGTGYFVQVSQEFCPPEQLERCEQQPTLAGICTASSSMLADEGFASQLGGALPPELK